MKPTLTELLSWTKKHASRFAWTMPADLECLADWATIQTKYVVTLSELEEVSEKMVMNTKDVFGKENHLKTLNNILHGLRERKVYAVIEDDQRGTCTTCGAGCGLVSVPEPRQLVAGEWIGVQFTFVYCSCTDGFRYRNTKNHKEQPLMSLFDYERRINPFWKIHVKSYFEKMMSENQVMSLARNLDGKVGVNLSVLDKLQLKIIGRMNDDIDNAYIAERAGNTQMNLPTMLTSNDNQIYDRTGL
jgi:hypothetical protein